MATKKGVWNLQDVRDKQLQSESLWKYNAPGDPSRLFSLGRNDNGQLGHGDGANYSSPVQIEGTWDKIFPIAPQGRYQAYASKAPGTLYAWGRNIYGGLGQNDRTARTTPVQIPGTNWSQTDSSETHVMGIKTDGTLWSWGRNQDGELGHNQGPGNNDDCRSSPTQIPGTNWSQVAAISDESTLALKTDGTIWSWGNNQYGQLGKSSLTKYSSPVQIGSGTNWSTINGGNDLVCAIKTNGELWTWGRNTSGGLGTNQAYANANYKNSPVQVPGTSWASAHAGSHLMVATRTDGTLWAWGNNSTGMLGQNNETNYSSPVQIPGTNWNKTRNATRAGNAVRALKTDGTLWNWGYNFYGSLGQNQGGNPGPQYSSPVQIPGTWASVSACDHYMFALTPSS